MNVYILCFIMWKVHEHQMISKTDVKLVRKGIVPLSLLMILFLQEK